MFLYKLGTHFQILSTLWPIYNRLLTYKKNWEGALSRIVCLFVLRLGALYTGYQFQDLSHSDDRLLSRNQKCLFILAPAPHNVKLTWLSVLTGCPHFFFLGHITTVWFQNRESTLLSEMHLNKKNISYEGKSSFVKTILT